MSCGPAQLEPLRSDEDVTVLEEVYLAQQTSTSILVGIAAPLTPQISNVANEIVETTREEEEVVVVPEETPVETSSVSGAASSSSSSTSELVETTTPPEKIDSMGATPQTFKNFFSVLPDQFKQGKGDEYERIRLLFNTLQVNASATARFNCYALAELQTLIFWGVFSVYSKMIDSVTKDNVDVVIGIYANLEASCQELIGKEKITVVPGVAFKLGPIVRNLNLPLGKKLFHENVTFETPHSKRSYKTVPDSATHASMTLFDAFAFHLKGPENLYSAYASVMLAYIDIALSNNEVYLAGFLMRFTVFSIHMVTHLLELGHQSRFRSSDLYAWLNGMLIEHARCLANVLLAKDGDYEKRITNDHKVVRVGGYISPAELNNLKQQPSYNGYIAVITSTPRTTSKTLETADARAVQAASSCLLL
ncbi:MAG: hypothetical protein BVN35_14450 [Proteobacteria bacterium ST_bin11]|nr:MAG: hypothetical protein BVN35_14450 [Proteobacteria bacterium ST_bin11]